MTDPESFVRGVQLCNSDNSCFCFVLFSMRRERIQIPLKVGHHWPTCKTPFKWHFTDVPMMAGQKEFC